MRIVNNKERQELKIKLIFPPQWYPTSPYLSVPLLVGQLRAAGYDAASVDLNVKFYNNILSSKYLKETVKELNEILKLDNIKNNELLEKQNIIKHYLTNKKENIDKTISFIDEAVSIIKSNDNFYNPKLFLKSMKIINYALGIAMLPYYPSKMTFQTYSDPIETLEFDVIKSLVKNKDKNIYAKQYENISESFDKDVKIIGISIVSRTQILAALTLAYILKKTTNAKILLGGLRLTKIQEDLSSNTEIFNDFCDYILLGNGEKSIVKFADFIAGKIKISEVPGLLYKSANGKIIHNKIKTDFNFSDISNLSLEGLNLSDYFAPEVVMPIENSKGCYWNGCTICNAYKHYPKYNIKTVEKMFTDLKQLKEQGINHFRFSDNALPPQFLSKLADKIIENKLDIKFCAYARLEKEFTYNELLKLNKAGLYLVSWGLESASDKIIKIMNKGINISEAEKILQNSAKCGIFNKVNFLFGVFSESYSEGLKSIKFYEKNIDICDISSKGTFRLFNDIPLYKLLKKYNIKLLPNSNKFGYQCEFTDPICSKTQTEQFINKMIEIDDKYKKNSLMLTDLQDDFLFLYVGKYGREYIKNYKL